MYKVIVRENSIQNDPYTNELYFEFDDQAEALKFVSYIFDVSSYRVEIYREDTIEV